MTRGENIHQQRRKTVLIHDISALFTPEPPLPLCGERQGTLTRIEHAAIWIRDGIIQEVGPSETLVPRWRSSAEQLVPGKGWIAIPALVDPHTHPIFAGTRENEFHRRLSGASYLEILKSGGGILETVEKTRTASDALLRRNASKVLRWMSSRGVALVEAKSGYALDRDGELRLLSLLRELDGAYGVSIVPTYLGAHTVPPEFASHPEAYIDLILREVLPWVARLRLARFVDVFCEAGVFDVTQSERLLRASRSLGFGIKIHADELTHSGGTALGAYLNATSVDHCIYSDAHDMELLTTQSPHTVAVLLPATSYALRKPYAPAREFISHGVPVALATDFNPGTSYTMDPWFVMNLGVVALGMSPEEVVTAFTANAASAVGCDDYGAIAPGFRSPVLLIQPSTDLEPRSTPSLKFLGYATPPVARLRVIR
ncbi:MAG: imidazolonepropionase [bacterium JZ-2024 1]